MRKLKYLLCPAVFRYLKLICNLWASLKEFDLSTANNLRVKLS